MKWFRRLQYRFKAVSLIETIISLALIMIAFVIVSQTFVWSNKGQHEKFKKRIKERNYRYEQMLGTSASLSLRDK